MSELDPPPMERPEQAEPPVAEARPQPTVAPAPRKGRAGTFFFGALTGCLLLFAVFAVMAIIVAMNSDSSELNLANEKVAVILIEGEIVEARATLDTLKKYADNATVKAIVIRINSPGGAIAPSQEIYNAIRRTRKDSGKPIIASFDSVAASGGYYIAAACDQIVANPGSITGSIGVIMQWFNTKELIQWAKLKPETITSGAMKDAGSPFRELTPEERAYFQGIVTQLHSQFVRDVAKGRGAKMKHEEVARIADGRIFTGEQALELKLVDELGSIDDAIRTAGKLGGIQGEPARLWPKPREAGLFDLLNASDADALLERVVSRRIPQFLYRW
ncbi:MAG TPA: signal peptide peptidase SppA [Thermoanaerobaculia bacterium]|jgi:protease-4|nr:signal peptide peptidase SppA [Thermoanaerobaculia bacterium]